MSASSDEVVFRMLEGRIRTILPEEYQDSYEEVQPVSMGSAALKFDADGQVAWDEIWDTFCDLAMAGGPPHKGKLLEPGSQAEIDARPDDYEKVAKEICRGISLAADLAARPSRNPGWVRVECESTEMSDWLVRAIVMENVSARSEGLAIDLPAGPGYRVEKEIKNVITVIAKTCHYWLDHMWQSEQDKISKLFAAMAAESPLIRPMFSGFGIESASDQMHGESLAKAICASTGLQCSTEQYADWIGVECPDVRSAIWMMRAMVVSNVLSRREGTVLFVPINAKIDPEGKTVLRCLDTVRRFARARGVI